MPEENARDELTDFILNMLPTNGYITYDCIVQNWLDVAAVKVGVRLKELEAEGKIRSDPDGTRWKLRNRPVVVAGLRSDPNFKRGGK